MDEQYMRWGLASMHGSTLPTATIHLGTSDVAVAEEVWKISTAQLTCGFVATYDLQSSSFLSRDKNCSLSSKDVVYTVGSVSRQRPPIAKSITVNMLQFCQDPYLCGSQDMESAVDFA
eukprot:361840-Chlamydomonas_euryale.AAC.13